MAVRTRNINVKFMVTPEEKQQLDSKMLQFGTKNMGAYLRKMGIDGMVIKKDYSDIRKLLGEIGKIGSNINQIAKRANENLHIPQSEVEEVLRRQTEVEGFIKELLRKID